MATTPSHIRRIHHVNLRVRDLHKSVDFYSELFGLEPEPDHSSTDMIQQCVVSNSNANGSIGVVLTQGLPAGLEVIGMDHIGLEVPSITEVIELYRRAKAMNARVTEPRIYDGHWQIFVFDPNGYKIEVMTVDPPSTPLVVADSNEEA